MEQAIAERAKTEKEPQVKAGLSRLQGAVEELHNSINRLEERLAIVLENAPPSEVRPAEEQVRVPLAGDLVELEQRVLQAGSRVEDILRRCEL